MKIGKLLPALRGKPEDKKQQQEERAKMLKELELKLRIEQTELIANEFRRHSIYLLALVRFNQSNMRGALTEEAMKEIDVKCKSIESFIEKHKFIEKVQEDVKIYSPLEKRNKALEEKRARDSLALEQQRQDIINEVINSERAYVKTLNIVVVNIIRPIQVHALFSLVSSEELFTMFSTIEVILAVHKEFCNNLEALNNTELKEIGKCFCDMSDYFKIYVQYCGNQEKAKVALQALRQQEQLKQFFENIPIENPKEFDLEDFLVNQTVQRVCSYPTLIQELVHCTPPSHPDYNYLSLSTKKLMKVVTDVNFKITQMINRQKAKDIFKTLQFPRDWEDEEGFHRDNPAREFIREGTVKKYTTTHQWVSRKLYLFNDCVVLTKKQPNESKLKLIIPMDSLLFEDIPDGPGNVHTSFKLSRIHPEMKVILCAATKEEKDVWVKTFYDCMIGLPVNSNNSQHKDFWDNLIQNEEIIPI